jgi:tetratricopeptide (TPR) repeat protein
MKRGIGLLAAIGAEAVPEALRCFDDARALRHGLPIDEVPVFRYGLAACWLNRGEALMLQGDAASAVEAIEACDQAIALLRDLPLNADPRYPRRLAIAHQNRGLALLAEDPSQLPSAIDAFTAAIAVLESEPGSLVADGRYLQAAVYLNLANARAWEQTFDADLLARDAAVHAMLLVASAEAHDAAAAEVGLKARHVRCRTVSRQMTRASVRDLLAKEDVHQATDLVDEGLALAHAWERRGVDQFRALALELFQFGAVVYGRYQPHFLIEFVLENLDPSRASQGYTALIAVSPVGAQVRAHLAQV